MNFSVVATLKEVLETQSGTSAKGEWHKKEFVIEDAKSQYPTVLCCTLFNDKVSLIDGFKAGQEIEVSFNLDSRNYQGRYFHNVNAWRIQPVGTHPAPAAPAAPAASATAKDDDDLPF